MLDHLLFWLTDCSSGTPSTEVTKPKPALLLDNDQILVNFTRLKRGAPLYFRIDDKLNTVNSINIKIRTAKEEHEFYDLSNDQLDKFRNNGKLTLGLQNAFDDLEDGDSTVEINSRVSYITDGIENTIVMTHLVELTSGGLYYWFCYSISSHTFKTLVHCPWTFTYGVQRCIWDLKVLH